MAAKINLKNDMGGSVQLTPANTDATDTVITIPQEDGTLLTSNTIPAATDIMFGGVKLILTGSVLNISTI